jgi:hypothetical protein
VSEAPSRFAESTRSAAPRRLRGLAIVTGLVLGVLGICAGPASAEYIHGPVSYQFGPDGLSTSSFSSINTLAYQQSSKKLYVLGQQAINGFSNPSAGVFTPVGGNFPVSVPGDSNDTDIAVDNSSTASAGHLFWTPDGTEIRGFDALGNPLSNFPIIPSGETCGVAVDNEGHIWGAQYGNQAAVEWGPGGGEQIQSVPVGAGVGQPCKIAVDQSNGDLYLSSYSSPTRVARFPKSTGYTPFTAFEPLGESNNRIAVNATRHVVYVGSPYGSKVFSFSTITGELLETFTISEGNVQGLAVQDSTDTVFVASNGKVLELRGIAIPKATTGEPTANSTVSGTADTDGAGTITECYFEYGTEGADGTSPYGTKQSCDQSFPMTEGEPPRALSATIPGLLGEETYHYRLVLVNANGKAFGADKTITPHNVKGLKTEAATEVARTTAKLNGSFEGTNEPTTYFFEYGTTSAYGSRLPVATEEDAGSTSGLTPMSVVVGGLTPDTTYHFRVVGKNPIGTSPGKDASFKTPRAVEGVTTGGASEITRTTAALHGSFTGNGESHTFAFEWGPTSAYGNISPAEPAGNATGMIAVSQVVEGFQVYLPNSHPYHYRLVATNSTGSSYGADQTFSTEAPLPPVISNQASSAVGPAGATLTGEVNPGEGETIYAFEYGDDATYGSATPLSESIGADATNHRVSSQLAGLIPGTTYHYRLVAINFSGTAHGPDQAFTTPDVPKIESTTATEITSSSAHLSVAVSGKARATQVHFEYGPTASYGNSSAAFGIAASLISVGLDSGLSNLSSGTTYHYRAVAVNEIGTTTGPDQTFTTSPAPLKALPTTKCKKGFVKRQGRCVKKPHHKKKKRQHNRRHG